MTALYIVVFTVAIYLWCHVCITFYLYYYQRAVRVCATYCLPDMNLFLSPFSFFYLSFNETESAKPNCPLGINKVV